MARTFGGHSEAELLRIDAARTQGPWEEYMDGLWIRSHAGDLVSLLYARDDDDKNNDAEFREGDDAKITAAAVNALPDLLAEVARMRTVPWLTHKYPCDFFRYTKTDAPAGAKCTCGLNDFLEDR